VSEKELDEAMAVLARCRGGSGDVRGAVLLAHAEDPAEIVVARGRSGLDASPRNYAAYLASRPPVAEERAIEMMIRLCRKHRGRVHIVHVSAATALPALAAARQVGLPISTETCPHYLAFAAEKIGDGRTMFKCAPPIREGMNRELLWKGLREGVIDLIASDHSPCPPELKQLDAGHFAAAWGGISSLQLGLPVVWTQARSRGFGIADVSRWMSAAPARLAGIDGFKGRIAPGYDADLLIFDPDEQWTVRGASLHHRHKLTPYDGSSLRGVVKRTILRGETVFDSSLANPFPMEPAGRWITRTRT
jgi:allantoinase